MIIVAGHIRVEGNHRNAFLEDSAEAVRLARREPECLDFCVSPDVVDEERINIYERWQTRSALMSFRGEGPTDDLNALVIEAEVDEFEVQPVDHIPAR